MAPDDREKPKRVFLAKLRPGMTDAELKAACDLLNEQAKRLRGEKPEKKK